jgi:hypothetical protein
MIRRGVVLAVTLALAGCVSADGSYKMPNLRELTSKGIEGAASPHWAGLSELGGIQTALMHSRLAKTPIAYDEIAYAYNDVWAASDEFKRRDAIAAARERIDRANAQLEGVKSFVVRVDFPLPAYDFEKGGFPSGLSNATCIPMPEVTTHIRGASYAIALTNGASFSVARVPVHAAREALGRDLEPPHDRPLGAGNPLVPEKGKRSFSNPVRREGVVDEDDVMPRLRRRIPDPPLGEEHPHKRSRERVLLEQRRRDRRSPLLQDFVAILVAAPRVEVRTPDGE